MTRTKNIFCKKSGPGKTFFANKVVQPWPDRPTADDGLDIRLNKCLGVQKNHLIATVLLSTCYMCFG